MRYPYYENMRQDVLDLVPRRSYQSILEIGGGEFPTLRSLGKQFGAELWGADLYLPKNKDFKFVHGSIESEETQSQIPDNYFDLILANDVLEHLVDTESFMEMLFKKLKVGGSFVCSVPNARQVRLLYNLVVKGSFPRAESGLFDKTHLRWFCKKDVIRFAQDAGFRLEDLGASGKLVPSAIQRTILAEFLALQNLFVFTKD